MSLESLSYSKDSSDRKRLNRQPTNDIDRRQKTEDKRVGNLNFSTPQQEQHMTGRLILIVAISVAAVIGMVIMGRAMDGKEKDEAQK